MAGRRTDGEEQSRAKRQKTSSSSTADMDPKANPYLAHMYEDSGYEGSSNGYASPRSRLNGTQQSSSLSHFKRHASTSAMASKAEDGPNNPFTSKPLSKQYFSILQTRRGLPVHAQRYACF